MTNQSRHDSALNRPNRRFTPRSLAKFLAFCLTFSSLAVALSENALGRAVGRPAQQPAQEPRDAGNKADDEKEALLLEPGKAIKRILADADSHTYRIRLSAEQFLKAIIEQDGIDVVARLLGPDGEQIMEFDGEGRLRGLEPVGYVAEADGDYRLVVRPKQKKAPTAGGMRFGSRSCAPRPMMTALCMKRASCIRKPATCATQANMTKRCRLLNARWRFGKGG